ncbi:LysR family transcriptional regulator, partial [Acinetobacter baumannii]
FAVLARCGSVTAAAAELGVTPGAISRQLAGLEARLKVRLAERGARGITLTDAGQDLAQRLADSFTLITQAIHRFDQGRPQR